MKIHVTEISDKALEDRLSGDGPALGGLPTSNGPLNRIRGQMRAQALIEMRAAITVN